MSLLKGAWNMWMKNITSLGSLPVMGLIFLGLLALGKVAIALEFFLAIAFSFGLILVIRFFFFKLRPGRTKKKFNSLLERLDESSFPSIHAARAVIIPLILSQGLSIFPAILLWFIGFWIATSRIYLKKHHIIDVVVGAVFGFVISYIFILLV